MKQGGCQMGEIEVRRLLSSQALWELYLCAFFGVVQNLWRVLLSKWWGDPSDNFVCCEDRLPSASGGMTPSAYCIHNPKLRGGTVWVHFKLSVHCGSKSMTSWSLIPSHGIRTYVSQRIMEELPQNTTKLPFWEKLTQLMVDSSSTLCILDVLLECSSNTSVRYSYCRLMRVAFFASPIKVHFWFWYQQDVWNVLNQYNICGIKKHPNDHS